MAVSSDSIQSPASEANGSAEIDGLKTQVQALQEECRKLRDTLAKTESEREAYRQLFLQEARDRREFEDLDIPTLERMSAGPVENLSKYKEMLTQHVKRLLRLRRAKEALAALRQPEQAAARP